MAKAGTTEAGSREAVGVFDDWSTLEAAVDELKAGGFAGDDISLLAGHVTVEEKLGHMYARVQDAEDDPAAPRTAFVSSKGIGQREDFVIGSLTALPPLMAAGIVVASTGAVAAAIAGTAVVGATLGTVLARWMDQRHADWLQEQLDRGGILLWVRTPDQEAEKRAAAILSRHSGKSVRIHTIPKVTAKERPPAGA
jgi:hypothetical protein